MSRRVSGLGQTPDRTEQNRAALKALVKLEANKSCADCKRNKHPRWASWNLGVFVCIRCSGVHRGMGTHISRVKSVDLDSWTDEQMQNMVRWGNARANKYWEHKLAEGHVPNESKIENFIRTKYDSKRWTMEGGVPSDPSVLDDGDDDVPLNVVRDKAIERRASQRNGAVGAGVVRGIQPPPRTRPQDVDLFGDAGDAAPVRPSTTEPAVQRMAPPKAPAAPPKQTKPGESLLGLDFFGGTQSAPPARPSSTGQATSGVPGRADLKSSILSLYASKPAAAPQPQIQQQQQQQQPQSSMNAFAGMQSPPLTSPSMQQPSSTSSFGGMNDAFSSLSFSSPQQPTQAQPSAFSNFAPPTSNARQPSNAKSALSGGSFFDMKPAAPPKPSAPQSQPVPRKASFGADFGDFSSAAASPPLASTASTMKSPPANPTSMPSLFDIPAPAPAPPPKQAPAPAPAPAPAQRQTSNFSAFNLSQPTPQPPAPPKHTSPPAVSASNFSSLNSVDAWGSNDAWATPDPPSQTAVPQPPPQPSTFKPAPAVPAPPMQTQQTPVDGGWGEMQSPTSTSAFVSKPATTSAGGFSVQQDEEFGGWSHASPIAQTPGATKPSGGFGGGSGGDDLFGNVWE